MKALNFDTPPSGHTIARQHRQHERTNAKMETMENLSTKLHVRDEIDAEIRHRGLYISTANYAVARRLIDADPAYAGLDPIPLQLLPAQVGGWRYSAGRASDLGEYEGTALAAGLDDDWYPGHTPPSHRSDA